MSNPGKSKEDDLESEAMTRAATIVRTIRDGTEVNVDASEPATGASRSPVTASADGESTSRPIMATTADIVVSVNRNDVLLGRGATIINHSGNKSFHALVVSHKNDYNNTWRHQIKDSIARKIMQDIHGRDGRFLRRIDSIVEAQTLGIPDDWTTVWLIADPSVALEKIKQALRDKNPKRKRGRNAKAKAEAKVAEDDALAEAEASIAANQQQQQQPVASVLAASLDSTAAVAAPAGGVGMFSSLLAPQAQGLGAASMYPLATHHHNAMLPGLLGGYPSSLMGYNSLLPTASFPPMPSHLYGSYLGHALSGLGGPVSNDDFVLQQLLQQQMMQQGGQLEPPPFQPQLLAFLQQELNHGTAVAAAAAAAAASSASSTDARTGNANIAAALANGSHGDPDLPARQGPTDTAVDPPREGTSAVRTDSSPASRRTGSGTSNVEQPQPEPPPAAPATKRRSKSPPRRRADGRVVTSLLGQFNVFERVDVDCTDLYGTNPSTDASLLFPEMEFRDSYLWISRRRKPDQEGNSNGRIVDGGDAVSAVDSFDLPLLASTERLLRMLQEPIPGTGANCDAKTKHELNDSTCDATDSLPALSPEENGDDDNFHGHVETDRGDATIPTTPSERDDASFQTLIRAPNLGDTLTKVLLDIYHFNDRAAAAASTETASSQPRHIVKEQRRHDALEHQRERLQQKQKEQQQQVQNVQPESSPDGEISEIDEDNEEHGVDELCWDALDSSSAWILLAAALNSLRVVTPILLEMLFHESRNNSQIRIKGVGIEKSGKAKKARGAMCWLLGRQVYDTVSVKHCKALLSQLVDMYAFFGVSAPIPPLLPNAILCNRYDEALDKTMRQLADGFRISASSKKSAEFPNAVWTRQHPFDAMEAADRVKLLSATAELDTKLSIVSQSTSTDATVHAAYLKSIHGLHKYLEKMLARRFPGSRLSIYGSCLADLSLGKGADVDLSLHIDALSLATKKYESGKLSVKKYQDEVKKYVYQTCRCFENRKTEFRDMFPVTRARVPVCKGTYMLAENPHSSDGSIDFDICFLNDIAVSNSELLRQYSLVDTRCKSLMVTVKRWAKQHGISSTQDQCLSSYAWMNLVVFYLQHLGLVPNLQCATLMKQAGVTPNPRTNYWHSVNNLDTCYVTWEQASNVWSSPARLSDMSVTALLYGFYHFYAKQFPTSIFCISIKAGGGASMPLIPKAAFRKSSLFWCIEDPYETVDSHCPHDLGLPTNEFGASKIVQCIQSAEVHLRKVLLDLLDDDKTLDGVTELWPKPVLAQTKVAKSNDTQQPDAKSGNGKSKQATKKPVVTAPRKAPPERTATAPLRNAANETTVSVPLKAMALAHAESTPGTASESAPRANARDGRTTNRSHRGHNSTGATTDQTGNASPMSNGSAAALAAPVVAARGPTLPPASHSAPPGVTLSQALKLSNATGSNGTAASAATERANLKPVAPKKTNQRQIKRSHVVSGPPGPIPESTSVKGTTIASPNAGLATSTRPVSDSDTAEPATSSNVATSTFGIPIAIQGRPKRKPRKKVTPKPPKGPEGAAGSS